MILRKKKTIFSLLFFCVVAILALSGKENGEFEVKNEFKIIKSSSIKKDDKQYNYKLIRLEGENDPAYAVYYPNQNAKETILITAPYEKIDWSGERIDSHHWKPHSVVDATESANLSLINGFAVLLVYARFYEGGNINNDIEDIVAGLKFLENKTEKIGIYGGSWGGFEALYGAVNSSVKPVVGVAFYPPSDMESWLNWTKESPGEDFWKPYQKRVEEGAKNEYEKWNHEYIARNLETNFLIVHAYQDTLVPFSQSYDLVNSSDRFDEMWLLKKEEKLSHGKSLHAEKISMETMSSFVYLMRGLTDRELLMIFDRVGVDNYLADLEVLKEGGEDISWSKSLFEKMFSPNINYYDVETAKIVTSQELKKEYQEGIEKLEVSL
ncbi:prolyl oligopeptidase family serine peptidase [bacterium]|jgi:hypothetical protein|nr:prolyl oligopeptidase family serine peptidase [bacterium]MBT4251391.1 prolyl oligopeptidase family serine peptidase [bacterium]MBT4598127.1 prolyl oligopeptidase family serine peptidase [bacterium]MBT6754342.1 prolyl oligopeptidase family serine peptidase [bacterium]MBT7037265.1 prolyl oligopeptidase family serine peptidase [bacterium]